MNHFLSKWPPLAFIGCLLSESGDNVTMNTLCQEPREADMSHRPRVLWTWPGSQEAAHVSGNTQFRIVSTIHQNYLKGHAISQRKLQPGGGDTFNSGWDFSCSQLLSDQLSSRSDLEPELVVLCCFICCFTGLYLFRERGENSLLTSRDGSVAQMLLLIHFIYLKFNQTIDSRQIKTFNTQIKLNKIAHFNKEQRFEFIWYRTQISIIRQKPQ